MGKGRYFMGRTMATVGVKGVARLGLVAAFLVTGLLVAAPSAQADTFFFTSDHCTGGCGTPPFGTVTLTQNWTTVDVTVHLNSPNFFVKTGSADFQAFKFNGVGIVLADITVDAHTLALVTATGAFNADGTGNFAFGIACTTCGGGASDQFNNDIVFHVANATIADLTAANNLGNIFVEEHRICMRSSDRREDGTALMIAGMPEPALRLFLPNHTPHVIPFGGGNLLDDHMPDVSRFL